MCGAEDSPSCWLLCNEFGTPENRTAEPPPFLDIYEDSLGGRFEKSTAGGAGERAVFAVGAAHVWLSHLNRVVDDVAEKDAGVLRAPGDPRTLLRFWDPKGGADHRRAAQTVHERQWVERRWAQSVYSQP